MAKKFENVPLKTVKSLDLMNWLCHRGFTVLKVMDNERFPQYKTFQFADSAEIEQAIGIYLDEKRRNEVRK